MSVSGPISLSAYARHRGASPKAVSNAVKTGRLKKSVTFSKAGHPKITDVVLADREWEASTDLTKAPGSVKERADRRRDGEAPEPGNLPLGDDEADTFAHTGMNLTQATAAEKVWKAKLAELEFKKKSGELVPARDVTDRLSSVFTSCRTKLLGIPSRMKQRLPHLSASEIGEVENLVREALEELAGGGGDLVPPARAAGGD